MQNPRLESVRHGSPSFFLGALAIGLGLSVLTAWIATSYFLVDVAGSLVWPGNDGFCDGPTQAVGVHCFSDISLHLSVGRSLVPEDPGLVQYISNLPPGNRLLLWMFQVLASLTGFRATFVIYLALSALALLVPALWAVRRLAWSQAVIAIVLASVATVPFLAVLDRGNTIAFTIPLILVFVVSLWRGNDLWAITAIVLVSQLKPQLGLLVLGFFVLRRFRSGLLAVAASGLVFLTSFLVFAIPGAGSSPLEEFKRFVLYSQIRGSYLPIESSYPVNISFQKILFEVGNGFLGIPISQATIQVVTLVVVGLALLALLWRGRYLPYPVWIAVLMVSSALVVAVTFIYYFALVLVVAALVIRTEEFTTNHSRHRLLRGGLLAATVLSLTPLLIPGGWAKAPVPTQGNGVVVSLMPYFASAAWLVLVIVAGIATVAARPSQGRRKVSAET